MSAFGEMHALRPPSAAPDVWMFAIEVRYPKHVPPFIAQSPVRSQLMFVLHQLSRRLPSTLTIWASANVERLTSASNRTESLNNLTMRI